MAVRVFNIITVQIAVIPLPYANVIIAVARISVPHIVVVGEMVRRACIEIPISVIVPRLPYIISVVSGDHLDARQI